MQPQYQKKAIYLTRINFTVLFLVAVACFCYSVFNRYFAEINIRLPFLDFPIFIGEITLAVCFLLSLIRLKIRASFTIKKWHVFASIYFIFVLAKALSGYFQYGPLALRHAAMFYYPIFAIITYGAFEERLFNPPAKMLLITAIIFAIKFMNIGFFLYHYFLLGLALALSFKNKILRFFSLATLLVITPYGYFFQGARTILVGVFISLILFLIMIIMILGIKRKYKFVLFFSGLILTTFITYHLSTKSSIISLMRPLEFYQFKKSWDAIVEKEKKNFKFKEIPLRLYNPNDKFTEENIKYIFTQAEDNSAPVKVDLKAVNLAKQNGPAMAPVGEDKIPSYAAVVLKSLSAAKNRGSANAADIPKNIYKPVPEKPSKVETDNIAKDTGAASGQATSSDPDKEKVFFNEAFKASPHELLMFSQSPKPVIYQHKFGTSLFRVYVTEDMVEQILKQRPIMGFDFGKPFRSMRCEIIGSAYGEWSRDGWISPHNSFLDIIYRSGLIGIILLTALFINVLNTARAFLMSKSVIGLVLISIIIFWLTTCFFNETLELPYNAIPFWCLYGMVLAYAHKEREGHRSH